MFPSFGSVMQCRRSPQKPQGARGRQADDACVQQQQRNTEIEGLYSVGRRWFLIVFCFGQVRFLLINYSGRAQRGA